MRERNFTCVSPELRQERSSLYHGGAFVVGASSDLAHNAVRWYLREGFAVVSPEYRMAPHVNLLEIRQDILDSYLYIQQELNDKLQQLSNGSAPRLDTKRCLSSGGSAGGSSCLYLALEIEKYNKTASQDQQVPQLRGVIPAYPFCDPEGFNAAPRKALEERAQRECPEDWAILKQVYDEPTCVDFKTK